MPRGSRHDLIGIVLADGPRTILRVEDGGEWQLDPDRNFSRYLGRRVRVQGTRDGYDLLSVDKISLFRKHGRDAPLKVAERIGALALEGDEPGVTVWKGIAWRLDKLVRGEVTA